MAEDTVLSRELQSLHQEVSASHRSRLLEATNRPAAGETTAPRSTEAEYATDEHELRNELRELVDAIKEFVQDAEKNASAHPAATAIGAMVVGILIGRLLGRR